MLSSPGSIVQRLSTKKQTRSSHRDAVNSPACQINSYNGLRSWFRGCSPSCCIASSVRTDSRIAPSLLHRRRQTQLSQRLRSRLVAPRKARARRTVRRGALWCLDRSPRGSRRRSRGREALADADRAADRRLRASRARIRNLAAIGAFETTDGELIESRSWAMGSPARLADISSPQSARMRGTRSLPCSCRSRLNIATALAS